MNKKILFVSLLALGLMAGCGETPASSTSTPKPGSITTSTPKPSSSIHRHTWDEGEVTTPATCETDGVRTFKCTDPNCNVEGGATKTEPILATGHNFEAAGEELGPDAKVTQKACTVCGQKIFDMYVGDAEGWNNPNSKMNGKTEPNNKSTWKVKDLVAPGKYSVRLNVKLSYDSHGDRYWYNMHETDTADSPDKSTEDPFRYFVVLNGDAEHPLNPTNKKTWAEDGLNASDFKFVEIIDELTIAADTETLSLVHGDIGYSVTISDVRLVAKELTDANWKHVHTPSEAVERPNVPVAVEATETEEAKPAETGSSYTKCVTCGGAETISWSALDYIAAESSHIEEKGKPNYIRFDTAYAENKGRVESEEVSRIVYEVYAPRAMESAKLSLYAKWGAGALWAKQANDSTQGYYKDGDEFVEYDYRYGLFVNGVEAPLSEGETKATASDATSWEEMPATFNLKQGLNKIELVCRGGYRAELRNWKVVA